MKKMLKNILTVGFIMMIIFSFAGCTKETSQQTNEKAKPLEEDMKGYYVDVDWLKENKSDVIIIDANPEKAYKKGHIPGAINITWQSLSNMNPKQGEKDWGVVLPKEELEKKLSSFGINKDKMIVIYNDPKGLGEEGRVLWMLRIAGLKNTRMLNGGLPAWMNTGGETTKEPSTLNPVGFKIEKYDDSMMATTEYVKDNLGKIKIIDTRSPEEYNGKTNHGENYKGEKALGRIPTAVNLHFQDLYNIDGTMKSTAQLKEIFSKMGLKPEDEIVTYCTVGIRSGFTAEILKMCGYENVKNYNGSFSEWAGSGLEYEK